MRTTAEATMGDLADFAAALADAARALVRASPYGEANPEWKDDGSVVTAMDRAVERELRSMISRRFPGHGIIGEELGEENADADYVWVLDPIDGTDLFTTGLPGYATLIALCRGGRPVLGVIDSAATGQRWIGADGLGTFRDGARLNTRPCPTLDRAIVATYSPDYFKGAERRSLERLVESTLLRVYGGSSLSYGQLAAGMIDLGIEARHNIVDYAALVPIVGNAGGSITDWQGNDLTLASGDLFLACGDRRLHEAVLELLAENCATAGPREL